MKGELLRPLQAACFVLWSILPMYLSSDRSDSKYKVPNYQNGHAYLTSHRICYVAVDEPRKYSVGIDLKEIDKPDYQVRK